MRIGFAALTIVAFAVTGGALLLRAGHAPGAAAAAPEKARVICTDDVRHPITLRVVPESAVAPGAVVTARIELETHVRFEDMTIRIEPPADVTLLTARTIDVGTLADAETRRAPIRVRLPAGDERRTVAVRATGSIDGQLFEASTILNLVPGGPEPSRVVTREDGQRIHEVRATTRVSR